MSVIPGTMHLRQKRNLFSYKADRVNNYSNRTQAFPIGPNSLDICNINKKSLIFSEIEIVDCIICRKNNFR